MMLIYCWLIFVNYKQHQITKLKFKHLDHQNLAKTNQNGEDMIKLRYPNFHKKYVQSHMKIGEWSDLKFLIKNGKIEHKW